MGLILKENIEDECIIGIWNISEEYNELFSKVFLLPEEIEILNSFSNIPRKIEWLSVRVLLREMTGKDHTIQYNGSRKPFIKGNRYNISISHSKSFSSILLSKKKKVGIDLEYMSHRISRIAHKFINDKEVITENEDKRKYHLYIHWCAKEALYKICDKQDINFKSNLTIEPFIPKNKGELNGWVHNKSRTELFKMKYFSIDNYIIVYTIK